MVFKELIEVFKAIIKYLVIKMKILNKNKNIYIQCKNMHRVIYLKIIKSIKKMFKYFTKSK